MAMPCIPGVRPHKRWIVCSAPEMTTVSKPNRKPARAAMRDQKNRRRSSRSRPSVTDIVCTGTRMVAAWPRREHWR